MPDINVSERVGSISFGLPVEVEVAMEVKNVIAVVPEYRVTVEVEE